VHFEVQRDLVAHADPRLLQIVLENLFDNSWKFTGRQSTAEVRLGEVATAAVPTYFVMDNGAGFDQTFVHRLFQPFQRLHSDGEFPGTGIGLAIVHRIIVRHGGRIWAESSENKGATFYFTLTGKT
jgi:signal transduction histidine kinase